MQHNNDWADQCVWVKSKLTVRIEFLERTEGGRLRHSRFIRIALT